MADRTLRVNFSANTAGFSQGVNQLRQKLNELNTNLEQNRREIKEANSQIRTYEKELNQLKNSTNNGAAATSEQAARMQTLREQIATATARLGTLRTAEQELRGQIRSTNSELQSQSDKLKNAEDSVSAFGDVLKANLYSSAIQTALSKLTAGIKNVASYCYNVGSSFEAAMSQVEAVAGGSQSEMEQLTEKAKEMGATTKFTATEAAQAMNYMATAGWNAQEMLSGIDGVMSLAAASGEDLAQVSDIVTDAITAFGLKAEDVGHFSDILAAAAAYSNTNVSMMGETFQYCAPLAGALGFSVEDVSEAIGIMSNSGVKASMAGTALRTLFTNLSNDVKITGDNIGEVTIKTSNADGTMRSLTDILTDMRTAFSQLTDSEKTAAAESIGGKYAMSGLLALMNAGEDDVESLRSAIEQCGGSAEDMAQTMQDNAAGALTILKSSVEGFGIAVYDKFGESLKEDFGDLSDIFTDLIDSVENGALGESIENMARSLGNAADDILSFAAEALPKFIDGIANVITFCSDFRDEIGAVVKAVITFKAAMAIKSIISSAVSAITSLTSVAGGLNAVLAANPFGLIATAISVAVAGISVFVDSLDDCNERAQDLTENSRELADSAENYADKASSLTEIKDKYEEIYNSTDDAIDKETELQKLQDELEEQFGDIAESIDLVTGAYEDQISAMDRLIGKNQELSLTEAKAAFTSAENAEKESTAIGLDSMLFNMDNTEANTYFKELIKKFYPSADTTFAGAFGGQVYFDGSYEYKIEKFGKMRDKLLEKYIKTGNESYKTLADRLGTAIEDAEEGEAAKEYAAELVHSLLTKTYSDNAESDGSETPEEEKQKENASESVSSSSAASTETESYKGVDWSDFSSIKKYYKYLKDTDQISESDYWNYLEHYAQKLLDENSDEWREANAEIYQGRKALGESGTASKSKETTAEDLYDDEKSYLKWKLDMGYITEEEYYSQLAELRDKYLDETSKKWRDATLEIHNYEKEQSKDALDEIEQQYNDAVSAIDDEIERHNRDKEDAEINDQIADIEKQLKYDRLDEYSRQQLEQKKQDLLDEKEETQWQRDKEDEKDALGEVYTLAKEAYEQGASDLEQALSAASAVFSAVGTGTSQMASTLSNVTTNNTVNMMLNAVAQTSDQIAQAVIKALSSDI